jgi:hypothetical protein
MNGNGSLTNSLICLTILIGLSSMLQAERFNWMMIGL